MSFLSLLPAVTTILDKVLPDPKAAAEAKLKLFELQQAGALTELNKAAEVIVAEAQGNWLQKSWRPILMLTFGALIVARWMGWVAPNLSEAEYIKLWDIIQLGLGGYVIGRSAEKVAEVFKKGQGS
jgi:hypothetical protein